MWECPKTSLVALVVVAASLIAGTNGDSSNCDRSWMRFRGDYYKIILGNETRNSAKSKCEGGDLVSVTDVSVLDFLAQHLAYVEGFKFWVGLSREANGTFVWSDGTHDIERQPWVRTGGYDDIKPWSEDTAQGCFVYDGAVVKFNPCSERLGVICSRKSCAIKDSRRCRSDRDSFIGEATGNCLFSLSQNTTRDKANEMCIKERAYFLDFDDLLKEGGLNSLLEVFTDTNKHKYWTDLTWNSTHLSLMYPYHVIPDSGSCVTLLFNNMSANGMELHQTECDAMADVICAEPPGGFTATEASPSTSIIDEVQMDGPHLSCPEGYNWKSDRINRFCYWETSFETEQLSWNDAETYCKAFGGHLSSFHSVEEERIGLSFQYGSLVHPYWIGLSLDLETETYKWTDGTPLNYSNWAPDHPNHKDKQLRCVAMEAQAKHWVSSLCGILSWFICKVPAKSAHPVPVLPTPTPLEPCGGTAAVRVRSSPWERRPATFSSQDAPMGPAYFEGACYFVITEAVSWHRAKQYCENEGATLASIHSVEEIGFLLRLLQDSSVETNQVWIGLNSFGTDGNFLWTDWSGVDFTYFSENEPDNYQNQEKCCNMHIKNGEWSDENCNAVLGFICKRRNDTSGSTSVPSTTDPTIGNCKKGWIAYHDRCYYLGGKREKDRVNWTVALDICQKHGGYLTSIRNDLDQYFLSYLLQILGGDAWIGLHDTIQSGRYYWLDNSEVRYTNWAPGEPSFFGVMEDCVKLVYDHLDSGVWKDEECDRRLGYICQNNKDPALPIVQYERGINCPHPEGWLKLENMCFKIFDGHPLAWQGAEDVCKEEGGHLVSISDQRVKAVVSYLASELNQPFFIGLKYEKENQEVKWLNDHDVMVSNWEKNEPSLLSEDACFVSTSEGYWKKNTCREKMPFVCQTTTGKPTKRSKYTGQCPPSSMRWIPGSSSYCYILDDQDRYDWFTANLMCFRYGSHLTSIHSMSEIEDLKKLMKPGIRSVYIGLMRNKKGGYTWMDDSAVNFVNWDEQEPANSADQCVEMMADSMRWKVSPCMGKKHFVCKDKKSTLVYEDPQSAGFIDERGGMSTASICAVVAGIAIGVVLIAAAVVYLRRSSAGTQGFRRQFRDQSVSFENALYNVGNASMEFHDDENKSSL